MVHRDVFTSLDADDTIQFDKEFCHKVLNEDKSCMGCYLLFD